MTLRPVAADLLADLVQSQAANQHRSNQQGDGERGQRAQNRPEGQILEHVEGADVLAQRFQQIKQHAQFPSDTCRGGCAASKASTTCSMPLERDPFTKSVTPGCNNSVKRAIKSVLFSKCSPPLPNCSAADAASGPTANSRWTPSRRASWPASACSRAACGPSSAMSPSTSQRSLDSAASTSSPARSELGLAL